MQMEINFPGGKKVNAKYKDRIIGTDQPEKAGGGGENPSPFDLFLASLGTCAGFYVLNFCEKRGISTEGIKLSMHAERDPETGMIGEIKYQLELPSVFPAKYHKAIKAAINSCTVKKHLQNPPEFKTEIV